MLMAQKVPLPDGHPAIGPYVCKVDPMVSAGSLCGFATCAVFVGLVILRHVR